MTRLLAALALLSAVGAPLAAQSVSPPIAEYREKASGNFTLSNESIFPLVAVLDVRGFEVTERGELIDVPLDTARVTVKLSQLSVRIPARQSATIFYTAESRGGPAWFAIMSSLSGARTANGINLRIELPHVVYLNQRDALRREDVAVRGFWRDSVAQKVHVVVENTGDRMARVQEVAVSGSGAGTARAAAFPFLPRRRRHLVLPWTAATAPDKLVIRFQGLTVDAVPTEPLADSTAADSAAVRPGH